LVTKLKTVYNLAGQINVLPYIYIYILYTVTLNLEFGINETCIRFPKCSTWSK